MLDEENRSDEWERDERERNARFLGNGTLVSQIDTVWAGQNVYYFAAAYAMTKVSMGALTGAISGRKRSDI